MPIQRRRGQSAQPPFTPDEFHGMHMPLDTKRIHRDIRELRKILKRGTEMLGPVDVHYLRTRSRRIEAVLRAAGLASKRNELRLLRRLDDIRKTAGKVRDMDALISCQSKIRRTAEAGHSAGLLEYLRAERRRHARRLRESIRKHGREIRRRLNRTSARLLRIRERKPARRSPHAGARARSASIALQFSSELAAPATLNRGNLHAFRKKIKDLRYVLEAENRSSNRELIGALGKCKDAIGEWHDWEALVKIAQEQLRGESKRETLKKLRAVQKRKYEFAVSITNQMRRKYVHADFATRNPIRATA